MLIKDKNKEIGLRWILPFLSALLLLVVMVLPFKIAYFDNLMPFLTLIAVYYWSVFKPHLMPTSAVFVIGLLQDILSGGPLGMMALLLVLVRVFVLNQGRNFLERDFLFNWLVFVVLSLVFGLANWAVASYYLRDAQNFWNTLGQSILTIAIFPAVIWLLGLIRTRLKSEAR